MKREKGTVERFSPEWVRAIPLWLAKGIWGAIEDETKEEDHARTRETSRRRKQIERGIMRETNRGPGVEPESVERFDMRTVARWSGRRDALRGGSAADSIPSDGDKRGGSEQQLEGHDPEPVPSKQRGSVSEHDTKYGETGSDSE